MYVCMYVCMYLHACVYFPALIVVVIVTGCLSCSQGNLLLLSQALQTHEAFFIHYRIYLILEKLKMIVFRNLFKKV